MAATQFLRQGGSIRLVAGPMFSGKTTELIRAIKVAGHANIRCFLVRPSADVRTADVQAHCGADLSPDAATRMTGPSLARIAASVIAAAAGERCLVAVDEGQFFPDLAAGAVALAGAGIHVVVAALDGSFSQKPFESVSALYPHCDAFDKRTAICGTCRLREAPFTMLRACAQVDASGGELIIGGSDKYHAVCRACMRR